MKLRYCAAAVASLLAGAAFACDDARVTEAMAAAPANVADKPAVVANEGAAGSFAKPAATPKSSAKKVTPKPVDRTVVAREETSAQR